MKAKINCDEQNWLGFQSQAVRKAELRRDNYSLLCAVGN